MVTFLRPLPHAYGSTAVNVRLRRSYRLHSPSSSLSCRCGSLTLMAEDPSHPHHRTKEDDTAPTSQLQPEQQELTQHLPPAPSPPPRDVHEPSTSSTSCGNTSSWLQLGIPQSSSSSKRTRNDYEAGPSSSIQPDASPPLSELGMSLFPAGSSSPSVAAGSMVVAVPPPAHEAGTWFVLLASHNQRREQRLPQVQRSYLRVRDGRMTVRVVMGYLVCKLGLEDNSQLEITCRSHNLLPTMTLWHVRDNIWRLPPTETAVILPVPGSMSTNQVMTLHYGRR
ncbi:protein LAX PANICLE 2-like [Hordeum vulgare subsp. vulgare]|nr:protein LAX PANICLE 2-like [Hordeum vulgare subsp. vulgare]KAI4988627.1 hypothetical protein ZWY2020_035867 [Hordeum vulgare]